MADIPEEHSRRNCRVCCLEGHIYLLRGYSQDRRVTQYNPLTNTWRNMPRLRKMRRHGGHSVLTLDNKIFVLGGLGCGTSCEMLEDLHDDNPEWRYIADMNIKHYSGGAVVIERKIYVLGGYTTNVEVYDVDRGILMDYLQIIV